MFIYLRVTAEIRARITYCTVLWRSRYDLDGSSLKNLKSRYPIIQYSIADYFVFYFVLSMNALLNFSERVNNNKSRLYFSITISPQVGIAG